MRVYDKTSCDDTNSDYKTSTSFTTQAGEDYFINIIYPNSTPFNNSFVVGEKPGIGWESNIAGYVKIELFRGDNQLQLISNSETNDGNADWTIPDVPTSSDYRIKITSLANSNVFGFSDNFLIYKDGDFKVIAPDRNSNWEVNKEYQIKWTCNVGTYVTVELWNSNDNTITTLFPSILNNGIINWTIPSIEDINAYYRIRIYTLINGFESGFFSDYIKFIPPQSSPSLDVSTDSVSINSGSGSNGAFTITSNTSWTISSKPSWLDLTAMSGSGDKTITVTANSANTSTTTDRKGTIILTGGEITRTISVTQSRSDSTPKISFTKKTLDFGNVEVGGVYNLSYVVTATNLTDNLIITAPEGFTIRDGYTKIRDTVILEPNHNGTMIDQIILAKFIPSVEKVYHDYIKHSTAGLTDQFVEVSGNSNTETAPMLYADKNEISFGDVSIDATTQIIQYQLTGINLREPVNFYVPIGFEMSKQLDGNYSREIEDIIPIDGSLSQTLFVRFNPTENKHYSDKIYNNSLGAASLKIPCSGNVVSNLCEQATILYKGETEGTTISSNNSIEKYSCWNDVWNGPEKIYKIELSQTEDIIIDLETSETGLDLFLLSDCDPNSCIDWGQNDLHFYDAKPGTYYLVVDGWNNGESDFVLNYSSTNSSDILCEVFIEGPDSITENNTAYYKCYAVFCSDLDLSVTDTVDVTSEAIWQVDPEYAEISSNGVLTTYEVNTDISFNIRADHLALYGFHKVIVLNEEATLTSIEIVNGPNAVNEGSKANYKCTAYYSDGSTQDVTSLVTWSDNSSYATISVNGELTAGSVSSDKIVTITASYGGKTDTYIVTIKNVDVTLSGILISGDSTVNEGSKATYQCTAYYSNGSTQDVTSLVTWSDSTNYADINSSGYLTTFSVSTNVDISIYANYEGKRDNYGLTIINSNISILIKEVQSYKELSSYENSEVIIEGEITAISESGYFIQDKSEPWSGIFVEDNSKSTHVIGESIKLKGKIVEEEGITKLKDIIESESIDEEFNIIPITLDGGTALSEMYESVLIQYNGVKAKTLNDAYLYFGEWTVAGTQNNAIIIDDLIYQYEPSVNHYYNITGIGYYSFSKYKLEPRKYEDIKDLTLVGVNELENQTFNIYPNPFSNEVNIEFVLFGAKRIAVTIYDMYGRKIKKYDENFDQGKNIISWNGTNDEGGRVVPGIYFINFISDNFYNTYKVIYHENKSKYKP
ncbi:MAG TPA: T9SS type A sorting domain-containing protein [Draconibacterium sp.]|nr:T9SS type A sorting domain-containing protein [Draconibacterium sp.]